MQDEWAPYPNDPRYLVSHVGEIFSLITNKLLKLFYIKGYVKVEIGGKQRFVHNLVLETFVGARPPGLVGRHLDDVHDNDDIANLAWGTHKQNVQDSRDNGTFRKLAGSECIQAKLTDAQVVEIRRKYKAGGVSQYQLATEYNLTQPRICSVVNFRSYKLAGE